MAIRSGLQINAPSAVCAKCGTPQRAASNFCGECGTRLSAAPALKPARCASRHATVLFCDVVGYTAMSERLDPEDVFALMEQTFGVILDAVHRQSGTVNQFLGDGAMALFNRAEDAIAAGLEILDRLPAVAAEARRLAESAVVFEPRGEVAGDEGAAPMAIYSVVADEAVAALGWRYESGEPVEVPDALYA